MRVFKIFPYLLLASVLFASCPFDKQTFTDHLKASFQTIFPKKIFELKAPLHLHIEKEHREIFLDNAYKMCQNGKDISTVLSDQILLLKAPIDVKDNETNTIFPVLKSKDFSNNAKMYTHKTVHLLSHAINNDLVEMYVFDRANDMVYVTEKDIQKRHISETDVQEIAKKNLIQRYRNNHIKLDKIPLPGRPGHSIYTLTTNGGYEASIIFDSSFIHKHTELIFFFIARDTVIGADRKDAVAIKAARYMAIQGYGASPYSISPHGYIFTGGKWKRYIFNISPKTPSLHPAQRQGQ